MPLEIIHQLIWNYQKIQLCKIEQSGQFLGSLLESLLKTGLYLMKNVLKPLAKNV